MSPALPHSAPRGVAGRAAALVGAAGLVVAALTTWTAGGALALDLAALDPTRPGQPSVALVLVALAALPAVAALVGDSAWPRLIAAAGAAGGTLAWVATAPGGGLFVGPSCGLGGACVLLVAAALATGPGVAEQPRPSHEPARAARW